MALSWEAPKDPDEVKDYSIDWLKLLGTDTIIASNWIVPSGLTKDSDSFSDSATIIWTSGGSAGESYSLTNRITTAGGRTYDRTVKLKMKVL